MLDINLIKKLVDEMFLDVNSGTFTGNSDKYKYLQDNVPSVYETIKDKIPNSREILNFMFEKMDAIEESKQTYEDTCTEVYERLNTEYIYPLDRPSSSKD